MWDFEQGSKSNSEVKQALTNPILNKLSFKLTHLLNLLLARYKPHFICVIIPQALRSPFKKPSSVYSSAPAQRTWGREKKLS